ncbi:MAG: glycosyltransferase family 1 protein [Sphingobacteriales bacterium]|nr:MAG: glycosyltransferase family 1 protein [Sphingobacteriales bacterium]
MNILYLCDEYPPGRHGGIGSAVRLLAREMVKKGHSVVVAGFYDWSYGGADYFEDEGVKVYRFRRGLATNLLSKMDSLPVRAIYKLFRLADVWQWDIKKSLKKYGIFLQELIANYAIDIVEMPDFNDYIQYCNRYVPFPALSVPVVVKTHGSLTYLFGENNIEVPAHIRAMEQDILKNADAVSGVSKYNALKTSEHLGYHDKIEVLYNGLEIVEVDPGLQKDIRKVTFTGTLMKNKGIYQLMEAWNMVIESIPDARLCILGRGPIEKIKAKLNERALSTVTFMGHVSRPVLLNELATSLLGVFPSFAESFGLAPMEAMLCRTAVIFTKTTTGPELVAEGVNGLLADPHKPEEIAEKICFLLSNPDISKKMGIEGQKYVIKNFSIDRIADNNIAFYKSVLSNNMLKQDRYAG